MSKKSDDRVFIPKESFTPEFTQKVALAYQLQQVEQCFQKGELGGAINKLEALKEWVFLQGVEVEQ